MQFTIKKNQFGCTVVWKLPPLSYFFFLFAGSSSASWARSPICLHYAEANLTRPHLAGIVQLNTPNERLFIYTAIYFAAASARNTAGAGGWHERDAPPKRNLRKRYDVEANWNWLAVCRERCCCWLNVGLESVCRWLASMMIGSIDTDERAGYWRIFINIQ